MGADDSWDADLEGVRAEVIDAADVPPDLAAQAGRPIERAVRFTSPGGTTRSVALVELLIGPRLASASDGVFIDRTGRRLDATGP